MASGYTIVNTGLIVLHMTKKRKLGDRWSVNRLVVSNGARISHCLMSAAAVLERERERVTLRVWRQSRALDDDGGGNWFGLLFFPTHTCGVHSAVCV